MSSPAPVGLAVSVVGFRTSNDEEKATVRAYFVCEASVCLTVHEWPQYYEVSVDDRDGGKRWVTFRRYKEFYNLNETVRV